jgi:hypothetical protein
MSPISADEVSESIKRLKPSKAIGADGTPSFLTKGCSHIFFRHWFLF